MRVKKTVIEIVILHHVDLPLSQLSLEAIGREMDIGEIVGAFQILSEKELSPEEIKEDLEALGSDENFFGELG